VTQFRRRSQILLVAAIALTSVVGFVVLRADGRIAGTGTAANRTRLLLYSRLPFEPATPSSCTRLIGGPWSEIITNSYECPPGFRHHAAG